MNNTQDFSQFRSLATIVLSTLVGVLFFMPIAFSSNSNQGLLLVPLGAAMGGMIGYKKRKSHGFFYLALFTTATLATLVYFNTVQNDF